MKKGLVLEIKDGKAIVMQPGGDFVTVLAGDSWVKGDVVTIGEKKNRRKAMYAMAAVACLLLFLFGGVGGYQMYTTETALISLDINPSIELSLNRFDRVIGTTGYNDEGALLLDHLNIKGKSCLEAIELLLASSEMRPYLERNEFVEVAVYSARDEEALIGEVEAKTQALTAEYPQMTVACHAANQNLVQEAHDHNMTPGKYKALLELQALDPDINIEDYASCGVGEIRRQIHQHHGGNGQSGGNQSGNSQSGNHGHQNGNHTSTGGYGQGAPQQNNAVDSGNAGGSGNPDNSRRSDDAGKGQGSGHNSSPGGTQGGGQGHSKGNGHK